MLCCGADRPQVPHLSHYLKSEFTLNKGQFPHNLKF